MDGRLNFKATLDDGEYMKKLDNMKKGVDGLTFEKPLKSIKELKKEIEEVNDVLNKNRKSLSELNSKISTTAPGALKNDLLNQRNSLKKSIQEDEVALKNLNAELQRTRASHTTVNAELIKTRQQMAALALVGKQNTAEYQALSQRAREYSNALKQVDNETKRATYSSRTFRDVFKSVSSYFGAFTAITTVISLLKSFYNTTKQLQTLTKAMELGSQNSTAYASNLAFLRDITERYGLELISTSEAYNKFYVASKNKLALEEIQLIFDKVSKSASLMGMSMADQEGIFRALEQMMSKGTVQSEELRMQLGDRLPGAFEIMARAMGVTTAQLNKMMEEGEVIASDVLPKFAIELERTFGADKVDSIDNITAAENRLKNEWTNFVETVNSSENVIGRVIMGFLDGISALTRDITRLISSWDRLNKVAGEQGARSGYSDVMARANNISQGQAVKEAFRLENDLRELNKERRELEKSINETKVMSQRTQMRKRLEELNGTIGNVTGQLSAYREIANGIEKVEKSTTSTAKKTDNSAKQRLSFINQIYRLEQEINQSVLSGRELELAKINLRYDELIRKAKELGVAESKINELRQRETEIVTFKSETDSIIAGLEAQKKDYEDFENFKKQVGVQKATEMYSDIIDVSKTYMKVLEDEMAKIDLSTATDLEKDRFNALFKMYQDYNIKKQEEDRKGLEELYIMTMSYEQKILALRDEYEKKKANLIKGYTGDDLSNRLDILGKEYQDKASEMIRSFADEKGFGTAVTQGFIGATKQIILAQIESLRNYLSNAKDLTKAQIDEIEKIITGLDEKLYQANDNSENDALRLINNQIKGLNKSLKDLEDRKAFLESLELPEAKVELAEIETQIIGINVQLDKMVGAKSRAMADEFGKLSNIFSGLSDNLENMGVGANNMFKNLSKISGMASTISNLFADMKEFNEAQKSEGGATFSQTMSAAGGLMSAVFGISGMIMGIFDDYEKAQRAAEMRRIDSYIKSLEFERELAALETERLRRNAISLSDKKKESESIDNEILIKQRQLSELMNILNQYANFYLTFELPMFGDMSFESLFGDVGDLQVYYDKLKQMRDLGEEMTQQQKEQLALLDAFWLGNRSWEELQQVLNNLKGNYLHDTLRPYVEQAIQLAKELEEAGYTLEDVQNMMREMATGTSIDELSNRLADAFSKGEDAVYAFGQTMEDVLKNAIVSAFKNEFIVKQMKPLFDMMGDMGIDGVYTQEELDEIRRLAQEVSANLQQQWDNIIEGLDIDFGQEELGGSARDGIKRITETQADRLTGILTGMQMDVIASRQILTTNRNLLSSSLDNLIMIEVNTRNTADNTYQLVQIMQNNQQQSLGL